MSWNMLKLLGMERNLRLLNAYIQTHSKNYVFGASPGTFKSAFGFHEWMDRMAQMELFKSIFY